MRPITLEINGTSLTAHVQKLGDALWVHLGGETFVYEPEKKSSRKKGGSGASSASDIIAPMPGKITKVAVSENAEVSKGQLLAVLEAMKMEYSLNASVDGVVKQVKCKPGDQVALGQLLVAVEPKTRS